MIRNRLLFVFALFVLPAWGAGQFQGLNRPRPVRLRVIVTYQGSQTKVLYATVELMDAVGGSSAMDKQVTDQDGRAEFNTLTGAHRIRVTGDDIHPYEADFEITPVETYHIENVGVRRKSPREAASTEGKNGVPAIRLKIPDNARKEFERGSKALERREWGESRKHFQAAVDLYPGYDLAYNGLGVACSQLNDTPAARQAFLKATELNDKFAGAQRNLARILMSERNYQEAAALLAKSLSTEPLNVWALVTAANAELLTHGYDEALAHARKAHTLPHPGLAGVHVVAALALEAKQQPVEAIKEYRLYLQEDPSGRDAARAREAIARLTATAPN